MKFLTIKVNNMTWKDIIKQDLYNITGDGWRETIEEIIEKHYTDDMKNRSNRFKKNPTINVKVTKLGGRKIEADVVFTDFVYSDDMIRDNEEGMLDMEKIEFTIIATYSHPIETKRTEPKIQTKNHPYHLVSAYDKRYLTRLLSLKGHPSDGELGYLLDLYLEG